MDAVQSPLIAGGNIYHHPLVAPLWTVYFASFGKSGWYIVRMVRRAFTATRGTEKSEAQCCNFRLGLKSHFALWQTSLLTVQCNQQDCLTLMYLMYSHQKGHFWPQLQLLNQTAKLY